MTDTNVTEFKSPLKAGDREKLRQGRMLCDEDFQFAKEEVEKGITINRGQWTITALHSLLRDALYTIEKLKEEQDK